MFKVWYKYGGYDGHGGPIKVYNVRGDSCGHPHFLVYINDQWKYLSAKHFEGYDYAED